MSSFFKIRNTRYSRVYYDLGHHRGGTGVAVRGMSVYKIAPHLPPSGHGIHFSFSLIFWKQYSPPWMQQIHCTDRKGYIKKGTYYCTSLTSAFMLQILYWKDNDNASNSKSVHSWGMIWGMEDPRGKKPKGPWPLTLYGAQIFEKHGPGYISYEIMWHYTEDCFNGRTKRYIRNIIISKTKWHVEKVKS